MEPLFIAVMLGWLLRQMMQRQVEHAIVQDRLGRALLWARVYALLGPTPFALVQWGNLLGDLQSWDAAQKKFSWAARLGDTQGALLGLGTAALALAKTPEQSQQAHRYFSTLQGHMSSEALPLILRHPPKKSPEQWVACGVQYQQQGWVILDDFLSPETVSALHQWLQQPVLWRHQYTGYEGAHLDDGLSHPAIYALAEQLIDALPGVFADDRLMYAWAFRYHQNHQGVALHHDSAHVNVNLWLTPEDYNRDPHTGGLVLYPKCPPEAWDLERYTLSPEQMKTWIRVQAIEPVVIPYRQGRMVLFNSRFLHHTQDFQFHQAPHQQRLNLTLLFGQQPLRYHPRQILPASLYQQGL